MWWRITLALAAIFWLALLVFTYPAAGQDIRAIERGGVVFVPLECTAVLRLMTPGMLARLKRESVRAGDATLIVVKLAREIAEACSSDSGGVGIFRVPP